MIDHLPIITLITTEPIFNPQSIDLLNHLCFNFEPLIPLLIDHGKYNASGYELHDTISNIITEDNDFYKEDTGTYFWDDEAVTQIYDHVMRLGNDLMAWIGSNVNTQRLFTANVYEVDNFKTASGWTYFWHFQDDFDNLAMMYSVRHQYPHLIWQQHYWRMYGDQIPSWAENPIQPSPTGSDLSVIA